MVLKYDWDRQTRTQIVKSVDTCFFEGPVLDVIRRIEEARGEAVEAGYKDIQLKVDWYYDDLTITIEGQRLETDDEFNARIEYQKKQVAKAEKRIQDKKKKVDQEYKTYMKLKKKYEGKMNE